MQLSNFKFYRKLKKGTWYQHEFTNDATQIMLPEGNTFWARYGELNRYTRIINTETYK